MTQTWNLEEPGQKVSCGGGSNWVCCSEGLYSNVGVSGTHLPGRKSKKCVPVRNLEIAVEVLREMETGLRKNCSATTL